jgi:hypothetical protein
MKDLSQKSAHELMLSLERFFSRIQGKPIVFGFAVACCAVALTAIFRGDSYRDVAACYGYYRGSFRQGATSPRRCLRRYLPCP